jgi:N-sulfoglucosamine sulfohydrolase
MRLAGAPTPKELDGKSFASLLTGSQEKVSEDFFCEVTWHDKYHPMRGIRTEKYKICIEYGRWT